MPPDSLSVLAKPAFSNRRDNPYNALIYSALRARQVRVDEFCFGRALLSDYDVLHVHWPESPFNASLWEGVLSTRALISAMQWMKSRGTKLVWTAHNLRAHEGRFPRAEAAFWAEFIPMLDGVIALSEASLTRLRQRFPELCAAPGFVIEHPHYRGIYPDGIAQSQARKRLELPESAPVVLFFGRVLGYKNVPGLIDCVRAFTQAGELEPPVLLVAGEPYDRQSERAVREAAGADPRVRLHLRFVPELEAQLYFRACDLVVLPYREIHNSGSAILALSFDRPVLMPSCLPGEQLQSSIGGDWVQLYETLSAASLSSALLRARTLPKVTCGRHLSALSPGSVAEKTLAAYRALLTEPRVSRRRAPSCLPVSAPIGRGLWLP